MRWINHVAQAAALAAVFNPVAVPAAMLGATAPDWSEWLVAVMRGGRKVKHRGVTHQLTTWLFGAMFFLFLWDWRGLGFWFCAGGIVHWIGDSLTVTGAPVGWWSDRRTTLLGGRLRTGGVGEFVVTGFVACGCAAVVWLRLGSSGFVPFFYDWSGFYGSGMIDGHQWRENRFNIL